VFALRYLQETRTQSSWVCNRHPKNLIFLFTAPCTPVEASL
jgi:hypothetical protein